MLEKIEPAVAATQFKGARSSKNESFVDAVAAANARHAIAEIRRKSASLAAMEKQSKIRIVGAMYHLVGGTVEFLA